MSPRRRRRRDRTHHTPLQTGWARDRPAASLHRGSDGRFRIPRAILGAESGGAIYGLALIIAALWCVWDANRQCLWDKIVRTRVVHGRA